MPATKNYKKKWRRHDLKKKTISNLRFVVKSEFANVFTSGEFAAIEEHAPRTAKGIGHATSFRIQSLTGARSILISGASAIRYYTVLVEFVHQFSVQVIGVAQSQTFPRHGHDNDPGRTARMASTMFDQTQHLLIQTGAPDYLIHKTNANINHHHHHTWTEKFYPHPYTKCKLNPRS